MGARLLRLAGALAALWLGLVAGALAAAPPTQAVSYVVDGRTRLLVRDVRLNVTAPLVGVAGGWRIWNTAWEPASGRLALLVASGAEREVWLRHPDGALATLASPDMVTDVHWSPTADALVMIQGRRLVHIDPQTGVLAERRLAEDLYTLAGVYLPLTTDEVLVLARRASGELPFYYRLNLQTGASVLAQGLPCGGAPGEIRPAGNGETLYHCRRGDALYLGTGEAAPPLLTRDQLGRPGYFRGARMSPRQTHVLFVYDEGQPLPTWGDYYTLRLADGHLRRMPIQGGRDLSVDWVPLGALGDGR